MCRCHYTRITEFIDQSCREMIELSDVLSDIYTSSNGRRQTFRINACSQTHYIHNSYGSLP